MTNKELQQQIEQLEQQIKDLKVKLESKVEKEPYEVEVPTDIEDYYVLDGYGKVYSLKGFSMNYIRCQYERGLVFKTRKQVEQFKKEQILLFKLHKWAEEHNKGWIPDWKDFDEEKNSVIYDNEHNNFKIIQNYYYQEIIKLPYFKSEGIADQFIKEFGDEIKEVLY